MLRLLLTACLLVPAAAFAQAEAPRAEFAERLDSVEPTLEGYKALVAWCEAQGLRAEARVAREALLARFPADVETHQALRHVLRDGVWRTRDEDYLARGYVKEDGRWLSPREAEKRALRRAERECTKALRRARTEGIEAVRAEVQAFSDEAAIETLQEHVRGSDEDVRRLAVQELGRRRSTKSEVILAKAAVLDPCEAVREDALAALKSVAGEGAPRKAQQVFYVGLTRERPQERVRAARAVKAFPFRNAVPRMIRILRESASGFGRSSISTTTQRAYVRGYTLTAGGTGLTTAEVADPEVAVQQEGTVLDVKVLKWERERVVEVLSGLTGENFGTDPQPWEDWWRENRGSFELR
ncbi:MAG: HEAT repeat domain-containing protein [Planctomycetes bacterium]|nr:HEAT repeat domain-containing protein [Planctomycetota bacterium]